MMTAGVELNSPVRRVEVISCPRWKLFSRNLDQEALSLVWENFTPSILQCPGQGQSKDNESSTSRVPRLRILFQELLGALGCGRKYKIAPFLRKVLIPPVCITENPRPQLSLGSHPHITGEGKVSMEAPVGLRRGIAHGAGSCYNTSWSFHEPSKYFLCILAEEDV